MDRRRLFTLLPAASVFGIARLNASAPKPQPQIVFNAPGDVTVLTLPVLNGRVKEGDVLATLLSIQLTRYQSKLDASIEMLAIEQRPFSDGRVSRLKRLLQDEADAAQGAFDAAQKSFQEFDWMFKFGLTDQSTVSNASIELEDRRAELATIMNELNQFDLKIKDATDRLAQAAKQLSAQKAALDALSKLLTIKTSNSGLFVASVGVGGFVQKGDPIGVLYL